ncbi:hypothetical protein PDENDC454_11700 [Paenibacillus dendritiformis C454]|uniref:Uncharacterized protein n=1 Tax=Paenibacillus dendritiformis C454 TaxID=1131935 RepID=H3SFN5_9BACL|nr:hypothetical protein PDENDC454_11700 [Paenibacillus dendritiformis C454]
MEIYAAHGLKLCFFEQDDIVYVILKYRKKLHKSDTWYGIRMACWIFFCARNAYNSKFTYFLF